ncbi:unnamed protein product [Microthlaspi erraticum]|uniref:Uncharacterized protein n=1 Tax=Microthlaspi erraticum TaxID=1685480 RepID=A0A6D2JTR9_9BRAS|nr:unnamed protein product [Microthlaspi erraticum]
MEGKVFLCQYLIWVMLLLGQLHGYKSCIKKEREALLELKNYIASISKEYPDSIFPAWTNDTKSDCCRWEEITCNRTSGRVTEIAFGTLNLEESLLLNLSLLHPFEDVRILNFSKSRFSYLYNEEKVFNVEINNQFNGFFDDVEGYKSLRRLRNLEILDLSYNNFNNSIIPFLNAATSLTTLFLRDNYMDGPFPAKELGDLKNLELLDLSINRFNGTIPTQGICKLKNMQELDLSRNKLVGELPTCLTGLTELRVLDLSSNQLAGNIPSALGSLESLEYLSLFDNNFEGFFLLGSLSNLTELRVLKLGSNSNSLQVVSEDSWKPRFQLNAIILGSCNLDKIPQFLQQQKGLRLVVLSDNKIAGNFPYWLLENNTELKVLHLQNNYLTSFQLPKSTHNLSFLDVSSNEFSHLFPENIGWILPQLSSLNISSNGFQGNLPSLKDMKEIAFLDLSYNSFQGKIPKGFLTDCDGLFTGEIGQGFRRLQDMWLLDMSNNSLSGVIPSWIGELPLLTTLLLSNNSLEGEIPISLFNTSTLSLLDLSANRLSGEIPPHVKSSNHLRLLLQDNNLSGVIPDTLLMNVSVLDLRNNRLSGNIPKFIDTKGIGILLLRGNNLTGRIPHQLCGLTKIRLLDLAKNRLNGSIPSCLSNTSLGLGKDASYYVDINFDGSFYSFELGHNLEQDSTFRKTVGRNFKSLLVLDPFPLGYMEKHTRTKIEFATKHRYDTYMGGNLKLLFGMDLSDNELSGEIPFGLGDLLKLQALNLSHNRLSGVIPASFSGLKNMESLDLSFNSLQGQIPSRLAELSYLGTFNVSFNNLSGVIPHGKQFNTFDTQSYLGNPLLCGQPTNKSCHQSSKNFQEQDNDGVEADDESPIDMVSFYWSASAAYVTILVGLFASLSFDSPWSRFWFYMVDAFIHKARNLFW